ncbi:MAG: cysteine hydrolase [Clostridiales bacterium]|jgi:nicotinamidase-related amidase|nr:cysteine hydrolase [Clostridiales bacterium]
MKRMLVVVDMQNDFVTGILGTSCAQSIIPKVKEKIERFKKEGHHIIFLKDTHDENYLKTQEGKFLPVLHCVKGEQGHQIVNELNANDCVVFEKKSFGSIEFAQSIADTVKNCDTIELCGVCTDICVVSNALILKACYPECPIVVDSLACAGTTLQNHQAALTTMKMCQIEVL